MKRGGGSGDPLQAWTPAPRRVRPRSPNKTLATPTMSVERLAGASDQDRPAVANSLSGKGLAPAPPVEKSPTPENGENSSTSTPKTHSV
jgi:hypothetical protein